MTVAAEVEAEIHRLHRAEKWPVGTIARQLGVHRDVVVRVLGLAPPSVERRRQSIIDPYRAFIEETLARYPTLVSTRIFDMLKERGFTGAERTVREHVAQLRPRRPREAFLRTAPLIGEQSQIDWAFIGNVDVDGTQRPLWMFVIILSWSRALWAETLFAMDASSLTRSLVRASVAFGGVSRQWLFDNPKTIVIERSGDLVRFHPMLLDTSTTMRVEPRLCAPRRANEKGKVERAIRFLRDRALAGVDVVSREHGNELLRRFCDGPALDRAHPTLVGRTVRDCFEEEKKKLLSLPEQLPETDEVRSAVVDKTAFVHFDRNLYSVPPGLVGQVVSVVASDDMVRVVYVDAEVARHRRTYGKRVIVENEAHRHELLDEKRGARDEKRREQLVRRFPAFATVLQRWVDDNRNIGSCVSRSARACDFYGDDVFAAAIEAFIDKGLIDPAALEALADDIRRRRQPAALRAAPIELVSDRDVTPHDLETYDDPSRRRR